VTADASPDDGRLIKPPALATGEERGASPLELFFDLAYVLVVAELAAAFSKQPSLPGVGVFAGVFVVAWWSWVTTTLYANRFASHDVLYRLTKLAMMFAVVVMAASAGTATTSHASAFALGYLGTRALTCVLYVRAWRHVAEARPTLSIYLAAATVGATAWVVSFAFEGSAKFVLWAVGIGVEALAPVAATRYGADIPLHEEHLPERFGLLVILVLGESITGLAIGLHESGWQQTSIVATIIGFLIAAAAGWVYFDLGAPAAQRQLQNRWNPQGSGTADRYVYGHLPLTFGLALIGVGIEQFVIHPQHDPSPTPWILHLGVALFLIGIGLIVAGTAHTWRAAWPWPTAALPAVLLITVVAERAALAAALEVLLLVLLIVAGLWSRARGQKTVAEI